MTSSHCISDFEVDIPICPDIYIIYSMYIYIYILIYIYIYQIWLFAGPKLDINLIHQFGLLTNCVPITFNGYHIPLCFPMFPSKLSSWEHSIPKLAKIHMVKWMIQTVSSLPRQKFRRSHRDTDGAGPLHWLAPQKRAAPVAGWVGLGEVRLTVIIMIICVYIYIYIIIINYYCWKPRILFLSRFYLMFYDSQVLPWSLSKVPIGSSWF